MPFFDAIATPKEVFADLSLAVSEKLLPRVRDLSKTLKPVEKLALGGVKVSSLLPSKLKQTILERSLNHALDELIVTGELDFLEGACAAIQVRDSHVLIPITFDGSRIAIDPARTPDVTISATLPAFLNLMSQNVDPDALFFQRQLSIEGDVELGLHVKNKLDALDMDDLPKIWQRAFIALKTLILFETK